jgi:hypothetical protein
MNATRPLAVILSIANLVIWGHFLFQLYRCL